MDEPEQLSILSEIDRLWKLELFVPYAIVMNSGSRYTIGESDSVTVGRSVVIVTPRGGSQRWLRQSQVSELVVEEPAP